jgi:hypothetical protein
MGKVMQSIIPRDRAGMMVICQKATESRRSM